jgi:hypothetical protein
MKNAIKLFVAVAIIAVASMASAQNSSSVSATASARIIKPITLTKNADLEFGNIINPSSGSATLTIKQGSTPVYSVPATKPGSQTGTQNPAKFTMTGEAGFSFNVTSSPAIGGNLTLTDGIAGPTHAATAVIGVVTDIAGATLSNPVADASGTTSFWVGGVLTVASTNVPGSYSNTNAGGTAWSMSVAY